MIRTLYTKIFNSNIWKKEFVCCIGKINFNVKNVLQFTYFCHDDDQQIWVEIINIKDFLFNKILSKNY